jgi:hypothetical protein
VRLFAAQPQISVRLDERGKVHYAKKDDWSTWMKSKYMSMHGPDFAQWKNAGKRKGSNKVTDPSTGQSYHFEGGKFFPVNKKVKSLVPVSDNDGLFGVGKSSHEALLNRFNKGHLVDRERGEREPMPGVPAAPLDEFDVGEYRVLKGRHEPVGMPKLERDHSPSASSLEARNNAISLAAGKAAAKQGMTIAISPAAHEEHSPTFRARANADDTLNGETIKRKIYDANHPASAFERDAEAMLNGHHAPGAARLTQIGAYRTMYRANTRQSANPTVMPGGAVLSQGVNPAVPAMEANHNAATGRYAYVPSQQPGNPTQGQEIIRRFNERLVREGYAT